MASKAIQVITIPTTIQDINTEGVIKVIVAAEGEEATEVAEVDTDSPTGGDAMYAKMTPNIITTPKIAQPFLQQHQGGSTWRQQADVTAAHAKYIQVSVSDQVNAFTIQVRDIGPTYVTENHTLVKMHDNHSNK